MPFVKPYGYVDGSVLDASNQNLNDDTSKIYINQKIIQADYADFGFNTTDIQRGELNPITNHYQFTTGEVLGRFNDSASIRDRSYWTSHTKSSPDTQTSNSSKQYQAVYECGDSITLEHDGSIFFTFGATFISTSNDVVPKGMWDSRIYLMYAEETSQPAIIQGTRCFSFEEETTVAAAGAHDPGAVNYIGSPSAREDWKQGRRWIQFEWMLNNLKAGTYKLFVAVNPKVEIGFSSARQFTAEVFYDEKYSQG